MYYRLAYLFPSQMLYYLRKILDTHCLVEWEEEGNPCNVVQKKSVKSLKEDGNDLNVGETCSVRIREGSKMVAYSAKLLGIGRCMYY